MLVVNILLLIMYSFLSEFYRLDSIMSGCLKGLVKMVKKHIVLVIRLLGDRSGGAEKLYIEMANYLITKGYNVTCLYYEPGTKPPFYELNKDVALVNLFVPYTSMGLTGKFVRAMSHVLGDKSFFPVFSWLNTELNFTLQLKRFFSNSNVDLIIAYLPPANTPSLIAAKLSKTKVIVTNHNVPEKDYEDPKRWSPNPIDRYLRRNLLKYASNIHVLFEQFGEWFPAKLQDKITAIPNYVPNEYFTTSSNSKREKKIIGVGRLASVKNYTDLVESWANLAAKYKDWKVEIYGTGPDHEKLQSLINSKGIADSFFLMGHTSNILEKYDKSLIFCHPAIHEGFGLSVAEALARDLPVIAYKDCEGVNQFVVDDYNGLLIERDSGSVNMTAALETLIMDQNKLRELTSNAKDSIRPYSEKKYYQRWDNLITATMESQHG